MKKILFFMKKVEDETKSSGNYFLVIKPEISGDIAFGAKKIPIELNPEMRFQLVFPKLRDGKSVHA